jgi:nitrous oxide reductase accessory protein NosL
MSRLIALIACTVAALWIHVARAAVSEVENDQEPIRLPYQVFSFSSCTLSGMCAVEFPAVNCCMSSTLACALRAHGVPR